MTRDPKRQAAFYRELFNWQVGEGPVMQIPAGLGGPEPGPGGHIRQGDQPAVMLYVQVRDLAISLARALELGAGLVAEPFDVPTARGWLPSGIRTATPWCSCSSDPA